MVTVNTKKRILGQKKPFKLEDIWRIRTHLEIEGNLMELALLNLAIDCKLRVCDVSSSGIIMTRVLLTQSKTSRDVQFEITSKTQHALSQWLFVSQLSPQDF
ncbi:integrase [Vibrio vulnificus]|nr:integrase [Vibrio vulnificus]